MAIVLPLQQAKTLGTTTVLPLAVYTPETYIVPIQTIGNAFLSSLVYKSGSGTLTVNYFQTTVDDTTFERTDIDSHAVLTAPQPNADQLLCTSIHNKLYAEIIITGSSVECGIIGTCVDQSSTSIDAFVKDNTDYNLTVDKGLIGATIDEDTGKIAFLRSRDGMLLTYGSGSGSGGSTIPENAHIVLNKLIQGPDSRIISRIGSKFAIINNTTMQQLNVPAGNDLIFEA
jgi:hypothetical protein